jgi:hypothetical protein
MRAPPLRKLLTLAGLVLAFQLAACGDDDDPAGPDPNETGTLSSIEAAALAAAVASSGALDPEIVPVLTLALAEIREHGTITLASPRILGAGPGPAVALRRIGGSYDAIGFQLVVTTLVGGDPQSSSIATGLFAWAGLDAGAGTVDEFLFVATIEDGPTSAPPSGSAIVSPGGEALVTYYEDATASTYGGTSGTFTWAGAAFSGSGADCSTTVDGTDVTCTFFEGDMGGTLVFNASLISGTGDPTVSVPEYPYDLPALSFDLSIEEEPPA